MIADDCARLEAALAERADPRCPHAPGRRQAGGAGLARHLALSHGRQRPLCGGLPDRSAADAVSRLARARPRPTPGSKRPCLICTTSRTPARSGACGSSSATSTAGPSRSTRRNWKKLDGLIRERADDRAWPHAGPRPRRGSSAPAPSSPGAATARTTTGSSTPSNGGSSRACQWGEFDTALYELERCWGKSPESPAPIGGGPRPATERTIRDLDDVHAADRALCREHSLRPDPLHGHASLDRHRLSPGHRRRDGRGARAARSGRAGRAGLLRVVRQRGVPDGAGGPRGRDRLSVQLRRRAACRSRRPAGCRSGRSARSPR